MNLETKKQFLVILFAVALGLVSAILVGKYIEENAQRERNKLVKDFETKKVQPLIQEIANLQKEVKLLEARPVGGGGGEAAKSDAPPVPKSSLSLRTPAGKRAYTVRIDSLSAVGGLINPGDYVDVIAHMEMPTGDLTNSKETLSSMVFQNIQILAVGTNLQAPGGYEQQQNARSLNITFALSPEESALMSFIERNGKMQLVLRAPAETEVEMIQASTWSALADYIFEKQGTELMLPRSQAALEPASSGKPEEVKPFIEMFGGGKKM